MKRKQIPLAIMLSFSMGLGYAQTTPATTGQDDSHKPNASKGQAGTGTVNVDPFTGTGSINIPIYDYNVDGLNFGINLSYSTRGIRVDELASPLGIGWNLSSGGEIAREVKGFEDEVTTSAYHSTPVDYYTGWLVPGARPRNYEAEYYDDKEQDIYNINLLGRSLELKFTDTSGHFETFPKSEIKVQVQTKNWNSGTSSYTNIRNGVSPNIGKGLDSNFLGFIVTDENGNKFYFERGDIRIKEYSLDSSLQAPYTAGSYRIMNYKGTYYSVEKWNLVKVVTHTGYEVNFEYTSKYMEYLENVAEELKTTNPNPSDVRQYLKLKPQYWKGYKTHITKITYPNNTIATFQLDTNRSDCPGNYKLQHIKIENKYDNDVKTAIFYEMIQGMLNTPAYGLTQKAYKTTLASAFNPTLLANIPSGATQDSLRKAHLERGMRLQLREIVKRGSDNTSTEPYYIFNYDTTYALPYRFSAHKDFYGYYNGNNVIPYQREIIDPLGNYIESFDLSIPYPMPALQYGHASDAWGKDRTHNPTYMSTYLINKVRNGCGGTDSIVYNGSYTLQNPDSAYGRMTVPNTLLYTDPGYPGSWSSHIDLGYAIDTISMQYERVNDGLCVSKIITRDGFNVDNSVSIEYEYSGGQRFNQGGLMWFYIAPTDSTKIYTNYNVIPDIYFNGSNHGFSEVTITTKGYNNEQLSKTKYTFSNLTYKNASNKTVSCLLKPTQKGYQHIAPVLKKWRMGILQKTEEWDENNYLTSLAENQYDSSTGYMMLLKTSTTTSYIRDRSASVNKTMVKVNKYTYDIHDNIRSEASVNSLGDSIKTIKYYNYDYKDKYGGTIAYLNTMQDQNMQFLMSSETWKKRNGSSDSVLLSISAKSGRFTSGTSGFKFFAFFNSNIIDPLASTLVSPPATESSYIPRKPLVEYAGSGWGSVTAYSLDKINELTRFDSKGNAIEALGKESQDYSSQIWDVRTGNCLAEVTNAKYTDIAFTSFEGNFSNYGVADDSKGNWDFYPSSIYNGSAYAQAMTGSYIYQLTTAGNKITGKPLENKKYLLSFWVSDSSQKPAVKIYNGGSLVSTVSYGYSLNHANGWTLYTMYITPSSGHHIQIQAGSNNTYIDEVRLHPADAMMTSYAYKPLWGKTSITSPSNYVTYYEFDAFGRVTNTRDMRGNIINSRFTKCYFDDTDESPNYDPESPTNPAY